MTRTARTMVPGLLALLLVSAGGCDGAVAPPDDAAAEVASAARESEAVAPPITPPPAAPVFAVRAEPQAIDFGEVPVTTPLPGTFTLHNDGAEVVTIRKATPSCKCTTTEDLAGRTIPPGGTTSINATLTTSATPGPKEAKLYVYFEGHGAPVVVRLEAEGVMPVQAEPPYVDALKGKTTGELVLRSRDGEPFRVLSSNGETPDFVDFDPARDAPRNVYTVHWSVAGWPCEGMRLWWVFETDRPECPLVPARIRHECTGVRADPTRRERGWFFKEFIVPAGELRAGSPAELFIELDRLGDKQVLGIDALHPGCTAELIDVEATADGAARCRFRFTPGADLRGMLYANVRVRSSTGEGTCPVIARVVAP